MSLQKYLLITSFSLLTFLNILLQIHVHFMDRCTASQLYEEIPASSVDWRTKAELCRCKLGTSGEV
jgi:hypothetical protein